MRHFIGRTTGKEKTDLDYINQKKYEHEIEEKKKQLHIEFQQNDFINTYKFDIELPQAYKQCLCEWVDINDKKQNKLQTLKQQLQLSQQDNNDNILNEQQFDKSVSQIGFNVKTCFSQQNYKNSNIGYIGNNESKNKDALIEKLNQIKTKVAEQLKNIEIEKTNTEKIKLKEQQIVFRKVQFSQEVNEIKKQHQVIDARKEDLQQINTKSIDKLVQLQNQLKQSRQQVNYIYELEKEQLDKRKFVKDRTEADNHLNETELAKIRLKIDQQQKMNNDLLKKIQVLDDEYDKKMQMQKHSNYICSQIWVLDKIEKLFINENPKYAYRKNEKILKQQEKDLQQQKKTIVKKSKPNSQHSQENHSNNSQYKNNQSQQNTNQQQQQQQEQQPQIRQRKESNLNLFHSKQGLNIDVFKNQDTYSPVYNQKKKDVNFNLGNNTLQQSVTFQQNKNKNKFFENNSYGSQKNLSQKNLSQKNLSQKNLNILKLDDNSYLKNSEFNKSDIQIDKNDSFNIVSKSGQRKSLYYGPISEQEEENIYQWLNSLQPPKMERKYILYYLDQYFNEHGNPSNLNQIIDLIINYYIKMEEYLNGQDQWYNYQMNLKIQLQDELQEYDQKIKICQYFNSFLLDIEDEKQQILESKKDEIQYDENFHKLSETYFFKEPISLDTGILKLPNQELTTVNLLKDSKDDNINKSSYNHYLVQLETQIDTNQTFILKCHQNIKQMIIRLCNIIFIMGKKYYITDETQIKIRSVFEKVNFVKKNDEQSAIKIFAGQSAFQVKNSTQILEKKQQILSEAQFNKKNLSKNKMQEKVYGFYTKIISQDKMLKYFVQNKILQQYWQDIQDQIQGISNYNTFKLTLLKNIGQLREQAYDSMQYQQETIFNNYLTVNNIIKLESSQIKEKISQRLPNIQQKPQIIQGLKLPRHAFIKNSYNQVTMRLIDNKQEDIAQEEEDDNNYNQQFSLIYDNDRDTKLQNQVSDEKKKENNLKQYLQEAIIKQKNKFYDVKQKPQSIEQIQVEKISSKLSPKQPKNLAEEEIDYVEYNRNLIKMNILQQQNMDLEKQKEIKIKVQEQEKQNTVYYRLISNDQKLNQNNKDLHEIYSQNKYLSQIENLINTGDYTENNQTLINLKEKINTQKREQLEIKYRTQKQNSYHFMQPKVPQKKLKKLESIDSNRQSVVKQDIKKRSNGLFSLQISANTSKYIQKQTSKSPSPPPHSNQTKSTFFTIDRVNSSQNRSQEFIESSNSQKQQNLSQLQQLQLLQQRGDFLKQFESSMLNSSNTKKETFQGKKTKTKLKKISGENWLNPKKNNQSSFYHLTPKYNSSKIKPISIQSTRIESSNQKNSEQNSIFSQYFNQQDQQYQNTTLTDNIFQTTYNNQQNIQNVLSHRNSFSQKNNKNCFYDNTDNKSNMFPNFKKQQKQQNPYQNKSVDILQKQQYITNQSVTSIPSIQNESELLQAQQQRFLKQQQQTKIINSIYGNSKK